MRKAMLVLLVLSLTGFMIGAGCGSSTQGGGPEEVMMEFLEAGKNGDTVKMESLLTERSKEYFIEEFDESELPGEEERSGMSFRIYDVEYLNDGEAAVSWEVLDDGEVVTDSAGLVIKEDGQWKVGLIETMGE